MKAYHKGLGVNFGGKCPVCGHDTGSRAWEKAETSLYKRADGKFVAVHPACAGGSVKKSAQAVKYRSEPNEEIDIESRS